MKIVGAFVGVKADSFVVDVDENTTMDELKRAIKNMRLDEVWHTASRLRLFVAKTIDGLWLSSGDAVVAEILDGMVPEQGDYILKQQIDDSDAIVGTVFAGAPTEKKTIHVLVKAPPKRVLEGRFVKCQHEFFTHLPAVDEVDGWLRFQFPVPLTRAHAIYVRSSYKVIADQALTQRDPSCRKYALVTGTPGNGKSVFLYYVLWRLMKDMKRVIFLTTRPALYFDGTSVWVYDTLPSSFDPFWSPDLWCLVDSADPTRIDSFPILKCSVILASAPAGSPQRNYIRRFRKLEPIARPLYMPVWTMEELRAIAPLYPKAENFWQHRFEVLGGIPRYVFQDICTDPYQLLLEACYGCSIDDCISPVYAVSDRNTYAKQILLHLKTEAPYQDAESEYATETALKFAARVMWEKDRAMIKAFVGPLHYVPLAKTLCVYAFEPYALHKLQRGGAFECRRLLTGNKRPLPENKDEEMITVGFIQETVESMEHGYGDGVLYVPKTPKCAPLDAWVPGFESWSTQQMISSLGPLRLWKSSVPTEIVFTFYYRQSATKRSPRSYRIRSSSSRSASLMHTNTSNKLTLLTPRF